jgi:RNA polymerase sigma-70 factor (ECF subfamily)
MKWFSPTAAPVQGSGFDALVRPHLDRLYRLAYRFTNSREDAEDLVQSLLIKLLPQTERLALLDLPGPWMARALYNLYIDQARQRRRQQAAIGSPLTEDGVLEAIADEFSDSPEQAVERNQREQRLAQALAALSDDHRALMNSPSNSPCPSARSSPGCTAAGPTFAPCWRSPPPAPRPFP